MLKDNSKLTNVYETIHLFWDLYIVDALIGNFDRHGANWGFLKKDNKYTAAPIFDNGSCLFSQLTDENEMKRIISSVDETDRRVYKFPTSQIKLNGEKSSYFDVISSLDFDECNDALDRIMHRIDMESMFQLVDVTELISGIQKEFYKHMINERYEKRLLNRAAFCCYILPVWT